MIRNRGVNPTQNMQTVRPKVMTSVEQVMTHMNPVKGKKNQSGNGSPIFPGSQLGFDIGEMRDFIKTQRRCTGYTIAGVVGNVSTPIQLAGDAKILLGAAISTPIADLANISDFTVSFDLNNEIVIDEINAQFFNPQQTLKSGEYFPFPRPLAGNDKMSIDITGVSAKTLYVVFYYI